MLITFKYFEVDFHQNLLHQFFVFTWLTSPEKFVDSTTWATNMFNSLVPGRFEWNLKQIIFKLILVTDDWDISCGIALRWFSLDVTDDKSTLVQAMAWCRQATSHYLRQCWPRSMSPYGVTGPQWVKLWRKYMCLNSLWFSEPYGITDPGQHWFSQWLVAWWHQAITCIYVDLSAKPCGIYLMAISLEMLKI